MREEEIEKDVGGEIFVVRTAARLMSRRRREKIFVFSSCWSFRLLQGQFAMIYNHSALPFIGRILCLLLSLGFAFVNQDFSVFGHCTQMAAIVNGNNGSPKSRNEMLMYRGLCRTNPPARTLIIQE